MNIYNRPLFYILVLLIFVGTYLDYTYKVWSTIIDVFLAIGIILALLYVKKPKNEKGIND
jgi:general stress protein CsbA